MRASITLRAEGRRWVGRRAARGAEGWVDIDLETVTTSCSYLFSGRAGQECVCAPAPVRTSIPRRQGTNMATPPPPRKFLQCLQHPTLVVFLPTGRVLLGKEAVRTFFCLPHSRTLL